MQKPVPMSITHEEYLTLEENADYKSEYYRGEIFSMAGSSIDHNRIIRNVAFSLQNIKRKKCEIFINDIRLWVEAKDLFTYPDIMLVCGEPLKYASRDDTLTNPLLIVEVLSESTKNYDRGEKFEFYRVIPTLLEYILIDQYKPHVEQFSVEADGKWVLTEYNSVDAVLNIARVDLQIPLTSIYATVEFEPAKASVLR